MVRMQIQLTENQHRRLKRWAARLGISMSEAVRRCVTDHLGQEPGVRDRADRVREALGVIGKYADPEGATRIAREHDEALGEAFRR